MKKLDIIEAEIKLLIDAHRRDVYRFRQNRLSYYLVLGAILRRARPYFRANKSRPKLTKEQVREILTSKEIQKTIAERYGVSHKAISDIKTGNTWKDIDRTEIPWPKWLRENFGLGTLRSVQYYIKAAKAIQRFSPETRRWAREWKAQNLPKIV